MLTSLQALRFYAAALIVVGHGMGHYQAMGGKSELVYALGSMGYIAIDIFFVLSGFVLALSLETATKRHEGLGFFFSKRLVRLFSTYWIYLIIEVVGIWAFQPNKFEGLNILGSIFLTEIDFDKRLLPVSWTLTHEIYYYIVLISMFFIFKRKILLTSGVAFVLFLIGAFVHNNNSGGEHMLLQFLLSPYSLEFFSGSLLYCAFKYVKNLEKIHPVWLLFLSLIMFMMANVYLENLIDTYKNKLALRVVLCGTGGLLMITAFICAEKQKMVTHAQAFISLGSSTYTLYLFHAPMLEVFYGTGLRTWLGSKSQFTIEIGFVCLLTVIIYVAHFLGKWIELPLYRYLVRKLPNQKTRP